MVKRKRIAFHRVTDGTVEYFCNKDCKTFVPEEQFTQTNIKARLRICRKCAKARRKPKTDRLEKVRACLVNFLRNHGVKDAIDIITSERVKDICQIHKVDPYQMEHMRIYPPNDADLNDLSNYHVVVFDKYKNKLGEKLG